jgi:hypothetical protein
LTGSPPTSARKGVGASVGQFWGPTLTNMIVTGMYEVIKWPEEMAPSRSPLYFTNELEVTASPETIWPLLVDPKASPSFYQASNTRSVA